MPPRGQISQLVCHILSCKIELLSIKTPQIVIESKQCFRWNVTLIKKNKKKQYNTMDFMAATLGSLFGFGSMKLESTLAPVSEK